MSKPGPKPNKNALRAFPASSEASGALPAPSWLDDVAAAKWDELAPMLHKGGCLTPADADSLALYADAWSDYQRAKLAVDAAGIVATSEKGGQYVHPAMNVKSAAANRLKSLAAVLGLGPTNRKGLNIPSDAPSDDPLTALKRGRVG